ncbi:MAG: hypothetical protein OEV40_29280 [Acidimicrobiia bacterium]|nr:hypothetical protein [Acidimicrobiia bacterium]
MTFVGIAGLAPGGDFAAFIDETGTAGFAHLDDESGTLWERFGTGGRSTFLFVEEDGSFVLTTYGVVDEDRLRSEVERLIAS